MQTRNSYYYMIDDLILHELLLQMFKLCNEGQECVTTCVLHVNVCGQDSSLQNTFYKGFYDQYTLSDSDKLRKNLYLNRM